MTGRGAAMPARRECSSMVGQRTGVRFTPTHQR